MTKILQDQQWKKRVAGALDVLDKVAKKREYNRSHTADGRKLKKGMKVFILDDPTTQWIISDTKDKTLLKKGTITLINNNQESIQGHPTKLFVNQKKAIRACIKDIRQKGIAISREKREKMKELDATNRIEQLSKLWGKL